MFDGVINTIFLILWALILSSYNFSSVEAFTLRPSCYTRTLTVTRLNKSWKPTKGKSFSRQSVRLWSSSDVVSSPASPSSPSPNISSRGRVNEIDFCMAPSDVSLSRYYNNNNLNTTYTGTNDGNLYSGTDTNNTQAVSLTRALNNLSNRAIRRILLSRSWPSAEALNLSLRQYLSSSSDAKNEKSIETSPVSKEDREGEDVDAIKCPVPRPILNIIMRRKGDFNSIIDSEQKDDDLVPQSPSKAYLTPVPTATSKRGRGDKEWVNDQIIAFRQSYGEVMGYHLAEDYLECILSLATSGVESPKVPEVIAGGVYDESYRRFISVLKSVGAVFEEVESKLEETEHNPKTGNDESKMKHTGLKKIAPKLINQDICLSMLDKIAIRKEEQEQQKELDGAGNVKSVSTKYPNDQSPPSNARDMLSDKEQLDETKMQPQESNENVKEIKSKEPKEKSFKFPFFFLSRKKSDKLNTPTPSTELASDDSKNDESLTGNEQMKEKETQIQPRDLGAVLLSAEEPSMTRQLNILANIVQRALLFGGDQELLVLSETLEADKPAFVQRWYPDSGINYSSVEDERRPGVQFLNSLVQLLKESYIDGVVVDLEPRSPMTQSYRNAYERLIGTLVELGSGYIKPLNRGKDILLGTLPKSPKEEFGRFAEWEVNIRQTSPDVDSYPEDLVGEWKVQDEIGGKTIGVSTVVLAGQGEVVLKPPLTGLRWRLDPGPTHLDTCTFQVLSDDGDIFQYKGFIDRGARLESRFSKRPIQIRGSVTFQMRDGEAALMSKAYKKDMLPFDVKTGTTRFVMTKSVDGKSDI